MTRFIVSGLDPALFTSLLAARNHPPATGLEFSVANSVPGFPCRITLEDAPLGEEVALLNYRHQEALTPYHQQGPVFIRTGAAKAAHFENCVPPALKIRTLSVRAFSQSGHILDADLTEGPGLPGLIARFWENPDVAYAHAHYAKRGCYAARITRA